MNPDGWRIYGAALDLLDTTLNRIMATIVIIAVIGGVIAAARPDDLGVVIAVASGAASLIMLAVVSVTVRQHSQRIASWLDSLPPGT